METDIEIVFTPIIKERVVSSFVGNRILWIIWWRLYLMTHGVFDKPGGVNGDKLIIVDSLNRRTYSET